MNPLLISSYFENKNNKELIAISGSGTCVVDALSGGIAAIGTLAYWAADNEVMGEGEMRTALKGIGYFLSMAIPLMDDIRDIADEAHGEMRNRNEGKVAKNEPK